MALLKNNDNYLVWLYINIVSVFLYYHLWNFMDCQHLVFLLVYILLMVYKGGEELTIIFFLHFLTPPTQLAPTLRAI